MGRDAAEHMRLGGAGRAATGDVVLGVAYERGSPILRLCQTAGHLRIALSLADWPRKRAERGGFRGGRGGGRSWEGAGLRIEGW